MCEPNTTVCIDWQAAISVDACLGPLVMSLRACGVKTVGCCCGHGKTPPHILISASSESLARFLGFDPEHVESWEGAAGDPISLRCLLVDGFDPRPELFAIATRAREIWRFRRPDPIPREFVEFIDCLREASGRSAYGSEPAIEAALERADPANWSNEEGAEDRCPQSQG